MPCACTFARTTALRYPFQAHGRCGVAPLLKSQFAVRIGLRVVTEADASYVIPDDQQAAKLLASLRHPGTGVLMSDRDARVAPVKFFRIEQAHGPPRSADQLARPRDRGVIHGDQTQSDRGDRGLHLHACKKDWSAPTPGTTFRVADWWDTAAGGT